jgi:hypothetical protein
MNFIENNLGIPALFVNGACGDINPLDKLTHMRMKKNENIYDRGTGSFEEAKRLGTMIGAEAIKVFLNVEQSEVDFKLKVVNKIVNIPLEDLPSLEEVKKNLEENKKTFEKLIAEKNISQSYRVAMAIRQAQEIIKCLKCGHNFRSTEIQILGMGDILLVGLPGEIFVEIGLNIKRKSGFKHTFICELSNDYIGYVPTKEAFQEPGYEVGVAKRHYYTEEVGSIIENSALDAVNAYAN